MELPETMVFTMEFLVIPRATLEISKGKSRNSWKFCVKTKISSEITSTTHFREGPKDAGF